MVKLFKLFWILLFLTAIILPIFRINTSKISTQENRSLTAFPQIEKQGELNVDYGKEFESWLDDRFWGRDFLISIYQNLQHINSVMTHKHAFFFTKTGWMFNFLPLAQKIPARLKATALENVTKLDYFCKQHGIKLYIFVVPFKEIIYPEAFKDYINTRLVDEYVDSLYSLQNDLQHVLIFPYDALKKASQNELVFFKESHHWTDYGAYVGYLQLISSIKKDFNDVFPVSLDNYTTTKNKKIRDDWNRKFNQGDTTNLFHFTSGYAKKNILKTDYIYYNPKEEILPNLTDIPRYKIKHFKNENPAAKYKVFLSGFSQNENLLQFLPYSFSEVKYYRLNNVLGIPDLDRPRFLKYYKKDLLEYKPDILILTIDPNTLFKDSLWEVE